jgi:predicted DNA-binding transcriptional regulator AlpA
MKSGFTNSDRFLSLAEVASAFGCSEDTVIGLIGRNRPGAAPHFFSIPELATRWRCSRATVYNRLRAVGAKVLDFAPSGKKGKKAIPVQVVLEIEARQMKRLC